MKRSKDKVWMFYQEGRDFHHPSERFLSGKRIRLVYPYGWVEWGTLEDSSCDFYDFCSSPCYCVLNSPRSRAEALKCIETYDKEMNFPKQIFIGEL